MVFWGQADATAKEMSRAINQAAKEQERSHVMHELMTATIQAKVRRFMLDELEESGFHENIGDDESLLECQILDSLSILKLISFVDEAFGIYFSEEEMEPEKFDTVDRITELIRRKLAEKR